MPEVWWGHVSSELSGRNSDLAANTTSFHQSVGIDGQGKAMSNVSKGPSPRGSDPSALERSWKPHVRASAHPRARGRGSFSPQYTAGHRKEVLDTGRRFIDHLIQEPSYILEDAEAVE